MNTTPQNALAAALGAAIATVLQAVAGFNWPAIIGSLF